jgi:hypothetical protein
VVRLMRWTLDRSCCRFSVSFHAPSLPIPAVVSYKTHVMLMAGCVFDGYHVRRVGAVDDEIDLCNVAGLAVAEWVAIDRHGPGLAKDQSMIGAESDNRHHQRVFLPSPATVLPKRSPRDLQKRKMLITAHLRRLECPAFQTASRPRPLLDISPL